jgi:acyl-[acyl-carrier-protein]-phospholipid O-acyltransferase/long-chain-fatty-acid--[acyl-carrier-protein] ligase
MFNKFGSVGPLFVRGPNVMLGYLKVDKPGVLEPPEAGLARHRRHVTIDEQGFISIKVGAKRFAKVGGEMISLAAVETLAAELWPNAPSAVVAVPDPRKGERLILTTQQKDATRPAFQAFAKSRHASDLMIPAEVWLLDKLPMLGTGKIDMMSLGKLVHRELCSGSDRETLPEMQ